MKAITIGENGSLNWSTIPDPVRQEGYVIIKIHAAGVNRADLLQAAGKYPPPPGWPDWPGLECAGEILDADKNSRWKIGDRVCALLGGGGYAEKVAVPEGMVIPLPDGLSYIDAAAFPEVYTTAMLNLFRIGNLKQGETVFVQAGASGLGIAAIQLAKWKGAKVVTTVGSPEKAATVRELGADVVINRKTEDVEEILKQHPIDVALDCAGGELLGKCLDAMKPGGRWILVATQGGETTTLPLRVLLKKHIRLMGSTLRSRNDAEKSDILKELSETVLPEFITGKIRPMIYQTFPMKDAAMAHDILKKHANTGKVVLTLQ